MQTRPTFSRQRQHLLTTPSSRLHLLNGRRPSTTPNEHRTLEATARLCRRSLNGIATAMGNLMAKGICKTAGFGRTLRCRLGVARQHKLQDQGYIPISHGLPPTPQLPHFRQVGHLLQTRHPVKRPLSARARRMGRVPGLLLNRRIITLLASIKQMRGLPIHSFQHCPRIIPNRLGHLHRIQALATSLSCLSARVYLSSVSTRLARRPAIHTLPMSRVRCSTSSRKKASCGWLEIRMTRRRRWAGSGSSTLSFSHRIEATRSDVDI